MNNKATLLITGGSGYLGQHLLRQAVEDGFTVQATTHQTPLPTADVEAIPLDLTDPTAIRQTLTDLAPTKIIHAAAINPGQGDAHLMQQINIEATRAIAEVAAQIGSRLVYVSTDVVHDGRHAPYDDNTPPTPLNVYGQTKAAGEAAVRAACPRAAIVRTSLIYGLSTMDRGTAGFVKRLNAGEPLTLFSDVIRQPVWVEDLATALLRVVKSSYAGMLNVAGWQPLTREAFGRRMLQWWQVDVAEGAIQSGRAADVSDTIPLDLRLLVSRAEGVLGMRFLGVDDVLAQG